MTSTISASPMTRAPSCSRHLRPLLRSKFDTLHSWQLKRALTEPIDLAENRDEDKELSKRKR